MLRYGVSTYVAYRWVYSFPLGTLIVNVIGCCFVGYLLVKGLETGAISSNWRLFLIVGMGGAFTTFSSFSFEAVQLLRDGLYLIAVYNTFGILFLYLLSTMAGVFQAKIV